MAKAKTCSGAGLVLSWQVHRHISSQSPSQASYHSRSPPSQRLIISFPTRKYSLRGQIKRQLIERSSVLISADQLRHHVTAKKPLHFNHHSCGVYKNAQGKRINPRKKKNEVRIAERSTSNLATCATVSCLGFSQFTSLNATMLAQNGPSHTVYTSAYSQPTDWMPHILGVFKRKVLVTSDDITHTRTVPIPSETERQRKSKPTSTDGASQSPSVG